MRGSEGGEGCWMFGGSGGGGGSSSAQLRADVLQIPSLSATHFASHVQMFKPFESHQPAPSPPCLSKNRSREYTFFFAFSALPFTGVGAVRVGVTGRSDISIQTQSRNDITQVGGLIGPPEG